jgi:hypothetical protein
MTGHDHTTKSLKQYADGLLQRGKLCHNPGAVLRAVTVLVILTGRHINRFLPQVLPTPTVYTSCKGINGNHCKEVAASWY